MHQEQAALWAYSNLTMALRQLHNADTEEGRQKAEQLVAQARDGYIEILAALPRPALYGHHFRVVSLTDEGMLGARETLNEFIRARHG